MKTLILSGSLLAALSALYVAPAAACPGDDGKKPKLSSLEGDAPVSVCPGDQKNPKPPSLA